MGITSIWLLLFWNAHLAACSVGEGPTTYFQQEPPRGNDNYDSLVHQLPPRSLLPLRFIAEPENDELLKPKRSVEFYTPFSKEEYVSPEFFQSFNKDYSYAPPVREYHLPEREAPYSPPTPAREYGVPERPGPWAPPVRELASPPPFPFEGESDERFHFAPPAKDNFNIPSFKERVPYNPSSSVFGPPAYPPFPSPPPTSSSEEQIDRKASYAQPGKESPYEFYVPTHQQFVPPFLAKEELSYYNPSEKEALSVPEYIEPSPEGPTRYAPLALDIKDRSHMIPSPPNEYDPSPFTSLSRHASLSVDDAPITPLIPEHDNSLRYNRPGKPIAVVPFKPPPKRKPVSEAYHPAASSPPHSQPSPTYSQPSPPYSQPSPPYSQPSPPYSQPSPPYSQPSLPYSQPSPPYSAPYTSQSAPYPAAPTPYQASSTQYPTPSAPFSETVGSYPAGSSQYPSPPSPYQAASSTYPASLAQYPTQSAPYPEASARYPTPSAPYQINSAQYPEAPPQYPAPSTKYSAPSVPYHAAPAYYAPVSGTYPAASPSYPETSASYLGHSALYPSTSTPYQTHLVPYPANSAPYPAASSPYQASVRTERYASSYPFYYPESPEDNADSKADDSNSSVSNEKKDNSKLQPKMVFTVINRDKSSGDLGLDSSSYSYVSPDNTSVYMLHMSNKKS